MAGVGRYDIGKNTPNSPPKYDPLRKALRTIQIWPALDTMDPMIFLISY